MKLLKIAAATAALLASTSAFAVQKDITVIADVDTSIELLQADGSALPQTVRMNYIPGAAATAAAPAQKGGLQQVQIMTKILTNDVTKPVQVKLSNLVSLAPMTNPSAATIPLTVSYNGNDLVPANPLKLDAAAIFPSNVTTGAAASQSMPLTIKQTTPGSLQSGNYQGVVSLLVTQTT